MENSVPDSHCPPMLRRSERINKLEKRKMMNEANDSSINKNVKLSRPPKLTVHKITVQETGSGGNFTTENPAAVKIKREAAKLFIQKRYESAMKKYTILIEMNPTDPIHYSNRAACYMMLENYSKGLDDARKSIELCSTFIKGHRRLIRCALKLHEFNDMDLSAAKLKEIDPTNDILEDVARLKQKLFIHLANECKAVEAKDYEKALEHIELSLTICPQFLEYKAKKAKYLAKICSFSEAETLASAILEQDSNSSDAHYALGRCLYEKDIEKSLHHFDEAFRLNENCDMDRDFYQRAKDFLEKKTEANNAYKAQNYSEAHDLYHSLLERGGLNKVMKVTLLSNMAQASYKLGKVAQCLAECQRVQNLSPYHLKTLMRRAQCYMDLKDYEKAIEDLQLALSVDSSADVLKMLKEAQRLLEASKNDFYGILGITKGISWQVVEKAYKKLTLVHHPDRHANDTDEQKTFHETKCKDITRAYRLLKEEYVRKSSQSNNDHSGSKESSGGSDKSSTSEATTPPRTSRKFDGQESSSDRKNNSANGQTSSAKGPSANSNGHPSSAGPDTKSNSNFSSSRGSDKSSTSEATTPPRTSRKFDEQESSSDCKNNSPNRQTSSAKGPSANSNGHPSSAGPNTKSNPNFSSQEFNNNCNENNSSSSKSTNQSTDEKSSSEAFDNDLSGEESEDDSIWARKQRWRGFRWNGKGKYKRSYCYDCGERVLDPDDPECSCTMDWY